MATELAAQERLAAARKATELAEAERKAAEAAAARAKQELAQTRAAKTTPAPTRVASAPAMTSARTPATPSPTAPNRRRVTSSTDADRVPFLPTEPVYPTDDTGRVRVRNITFSGHEGRGNIEINVSGDVKVTLGRVTKSRAELILDGVDLDTKLERTIDVMRHGSPVRTITSYRDPRNANRVILVVELIAPATPTVKRGPKGEVRWVIVGNDLA
jgi:hypothetical protein